MLGAKSQQPWCQGWAPEIGGNAEDDATNRGIDVGFKIFKRLLLEIQLDFNIGSLEAHLSNKVINEAMDEVDMEKVAAKKAVGSSGSDLGDEVGEGV